MKHRRTTATAALGLVLAALAVPATTRPADAAATCAGRTPTLVLTDQNISNYYVPDEGFHVDGGAGDDVILSTVTKAGGGPELGDIFIRGLAGDDAICASKVAPQTGEDGDPARYSVETHVDGGAGSDTLVGSTGVEWFEYAADPTGGFDTISDPGGHDGLIEQSPTHVPVTVDASLGRVEGAGVHIRWTGALERFDLGDDDRLAGSAIAEEVNIYGERVVASTGAGDDRVYISAMAATVSTGAGEDRVSVDELAERTVRVGLGAGSDRLQFVGDVVAAGGRGNDTFTAAGDVPGVRARLDGGSGANRIRLSGLAGGARAYLNRGVVRWGSSKATTTRIGRATGTSYADLLVGTSGHNRLDGGGGRDRLVGLSGNDRLSGGTARDRAEGGPGRDRCTAEVRISC